MRFSRRSLNYELFSSPNSLVAEVSREAAKQTESLIMEQLNELISRGLLVIEMTKPMIVHDQNTAKICLHQGVRLLLKDQEYVEKLENENRAMKEQLEQINKALEIKREAKESK